jgi:hypothetical protein
MELFNERFKVSYNEIDKENNTFIKNIKVNIDSILAFNECNSCKNVPNRIKVIFFEKEEIYKQIYVVLYSKNCGWVSDFSSDLVLLGKTKEEIYAFVIKAVVNGKKFNLLC